MSERGSWGKEVAVENREVPFDPPGNMQSYPERVRPMVDGRWDWSVPAQEPTWKLAVPFTAALTYDGWSRGRSAANIYWVADNGTRYPMFIKDLDDLIENAVLTRGKTEEVQWEFVKRGQNYGIKRSSIKDS